MDDIERAFLGITPEDFFRDTSATTTLHHPEFMLEQGMTTSEDNFHHFVNAMLIGTKAKAASRAFTPFSVLHSPTEQRYFRPDDDETLAATAKRLKREADAMGATWLFNTMLSQGRAFLTDDADDQPDYDRSDEGIVEAVDKGILQVGICWTAACREGVAVVARRGGIIYLNNDGTPGEAIEGDVTPSTDPFHLVLGEG